ncbi:MAG: CopG family transcriptional regulator [Pseudomonadota bacterium]
MTETLNVPLPEGTTEKLEALGEATQRGASTLAAQAIVAYVEEQLEILEGIQRGLADVEAGRVVPHDEAMRELRAAIDRASK